MKVLDLYIFMYLELRGNFFIYKHFNLSVASILLGGGIIFLKIEKLVYLLLSVYASKFLNWFAVLDRVSVQ